MLTLPAGAQPVPDRFAPAFRPKTFPRVRLLAVGAIVVTGRRPLTRILATLDGLVQGPFTNYHRVSSRAAWPTWLLGRILTEPVLELLPPDEPVVVLGDDAVAQHRGKCVYGKGRHRDAGRSSHSHAVWRWGHKWVVLAIAVPLPFVNRRWALPVLAVLYRPEELDQAEGRRHKTPPQLVQQMLAALIHWFPRRHFILVGDSNFATHALARFCRRHRRRATLVSRFYPDANLYAPPSAYQGTGRPRVKGAKRPSPQEVVAGRQRRRRATVRWYGGGQRRVRWVSGEGHWFKSGQGLVPVRWVFVRDRDGTHRDEYFFTTDPSLRPEQLIGYYTERWSIETTFARGACPLGV